ncbi:uncharacterized protein JCM15063_002786 [Sporobolomyces koalae]|uniref:uncharacterized protein n=1 Tax=Sporobolomyces koalae TaxID=500713 RepID=UPI00317C12B2
MASDPIRPTPNLSPPLPPRAVLFDHLVSSRISQPFDLQDPRVSLRPIRHAQTQNEGLASSSSPGATSIGNEPEHLSIAQMRDHEGRLNRLERLRQVFDSIPNPPDPATSSPKLSSNLALPPTSTASTSNSTDPAVEQDRKRWELERRAYIKELYTKCADTLSTSTSTSTPPTTKQPPCLRWSKFESYADQQERLLFSTFIELDRDNQLKLTKSQLEHACRQAGLDDDTKSLVEGFVHHVDQDGDGMIGWEEWRDFLILLPRKPSVKEIFHYYRSQTRNTRPSMSRLTQDGDVVIGRGKSSFNRFLATGSSSKKAASSPLLLVKLEGAGTDRKRMCDLHDDDDKGTTSGAVECRWAREEREIRTKKRKRVPSTASPVPLHPATKATATKPAIAKSVDQSSELAASSSAAEKEDSAVQASTSSTSVVPIPPTRTVTGSTSSSSSSPSSSATSSTSSISSSSSTVTTASKPTLEEDEENDEEDDEEPGMFAGAGKFLLAGGMAGAVSRTATAPFDRLKVYLITSPSTPIPKPSPSTLVDQVKKTKTPRRNAGSLAAAVRAVYGQGGVKAFWTGNMLNIIKIFPESAIKFLSYESAKRVFAQHWDQVPDQTMISNTSRFISGGIGGVVSQLSIYPIESLKTRVMSSTGGSKRGNALILETFIDMYRQGGIKFFFRGLPAGLIGVFPYAAIDMSTFEGIKISYTKWAGEEPGIAGSLCFGAVSGGVGATSVYPLNLVRTRLQAQGTPAHPQVYTGIKDAAIKCFQREGWRGFYKGLTPTLVKVVPAVAISYAVYDQSKKLLFGKEDDHASSTSTSSATDSSEES